MEGLEPLIVLVKRVRRTVKLEFSLGDSIAVASDKRALIAVALEVAVDSIKSAYYVSEVAVALPAAIPRRSA